MKFFFFIVEVILNEKDFNHIFKSNQENIDYIYKTSTNSNIYYVDTKT